MRKTPKIRHTYTRKLPRSVRKALRRYPAVFANRARSRKGQRT